MAVMRERRWTLRSVVPNGSKAVVVDRNSETMPLGENQKIFDAGAAPPVIDESVSTLLSPVDCTERFDSKYMDPDFPVETVKYAFAKRMFDIVFALVFLMAFSWLYLLLAIGVKLTSRGPIMFKQIRVGRGGRYFHCYKYRSMCVDAEARKAQLMHLNEATGPVFKIKEDPRITAFGTFMRKFSMDELPQFGNVLKGDMSIVGPRPPITSEVEMYSNQDRRRLSIQPGLTCLWQISGRSNLSFETWVELDLKYIDTMTFGNDIIIVLKTIPAVLTGAGAH